MGCGHVEKEKKKAQKKLKNFIVLFFYLTLFGHAVKGGETEIRVPGARVEATIGAALLCKIICDEETEK